MPGIHGCATRCSGTTGRNPHVADRFFFARIQAIDPVVLEVDHLVRRLEHGWAAGDNALFA